MYGSLKRVCTFALALLLCTLAVTQVSYSQGSGCHTATSADEAQGWPKGAQVCARDEKAGISQEAGEAKKYLKSILCPGGSYGGAGPDGTVDKLNPSFAQCAATFLKEEKQKMPELCLNEGYRTLGTQNQYAQNYHNGGGIACTQGANCEHPKGIAIDVNASNYHQLWDDAHKYGVVFYLRDRDKVHFVPIAHRQGKTSGPCLTENYNPSSGQFGPNDGVGGGGGAPSSGASNDLRNALGDEEKGGGSGGGSQGGGSPGGGSPGGGQPQGGGSQPQYESGNQQSNNQQPFSSDNNVSSQPNPISNLINDLLNSPTTSTSTLGLISQFVDGTSSVSTSTGNATSTITSVSVISSDISYLEASTSDTSTTLRQVLDTQNINTDGSSFASPSTFPDSNGQPSEFSSYSSTAPSSLATTVARLKELLILIISYLQPFRGNIPNQQYEA